MILQRTCPVLPGDTPRRLAARVFAEELLALPAADLARSPEVGCALVGARLAGARSARPPGRCLRARRPGAGILESPNRESGGIGRRARLRIWWDTPWGFESPLSHVDL